MSNEENQNINIIYDNGYNRGYHDGYEKGHIDNTVNSYYDGYKQGYTDNKTERFWYGWYNGFMVGIFSTIIGGIIIYKTNKKGMNLLNYI
jgi:hypothetical protein